MQGSRLTHGRVKTSFSLRPETVQKVRELRRVLRMQGIPVSQSDILELLVMDTDMLHLQGLILQLNEKNDAIAS